MVPIPKSGDTTEVSNLRPISLIPLPGKILEIFLNNQLKKYFEENFLFMKQQHGFRSKHSTYTAI